MSIKTVVVATIYSTAFCIAAFSAQTVITATSSPHFCNSNMTHSGRRGANKVTISQNVTFKQQRMKDMTLQGANLQVMADNIKGGGKRVWDIYTREKRLRRLPNTFVPWQTEGVVYILWHINFKLVYVGQTIGTAQERAWEHVLDAQAILHSWNLLPKGHNTRYGEGREKVPTDRCAQTLAKWAAVGTGDTANKFERMLQGLRVTRLEAIPDDTIKWRGVTDTDERTRLFRKASNRVEQKWIYKYRSYEIKLGMNVSIPRRMRQSLQRPEITAKFWSGNNFPDNRRNKKGINHRVLARNHHKDITYDWRRRAFAYVRDTANGTLNNRRFHAYGEKAVYNIYRYIQTKASLHRMIYEAGTKTAVVYALNRLKTELQRKGININMYRSLRKLNAVMVLPFLHKAFQGWLTRLRRLMEIHRPILPARIQTTLGSPQIFWCYDLQLGRGIINTSAVIASIDYGAYLLAKQQCQAAGVPNNEDNNTYLQSIKQQHCTCGRLNNNGDKQYEQFYGKGRQHVCTNNRSILANPVLERFLDFGLNYRHNTTRTADGDLYVDCMFYTVVQEAFGEMLAEFTQGPENQGFEQAAAAAWAGLIKHDLQRDIQNTVGQRTRNATQEERDEVIADCKKHRQDREAGRIPDYLPAMPGHIKRARENWALTITDKAQHTLTVACKYMLMADAIKEFDDDTGTHFYQLQPGLTEQHCVNAGAQILRQEGLMPMKRNASGRQEEDFIQQVAKVGAAAKQLKPTLKWRWLSVGAFVTLLPLYEWLTWGMRGVYKVAQEMWTKVQVDSGFCRQDGSDAVKCWMIDTADVIEPRVRRLHDAPDHDGEPMLSEDVEQLFSNIDQTDLLRQMNNC